jgi:glycine cleavage system H protein
MKQIGELRFPEDLRYARDHEWIRPGSGACQVGISDYAQDQLGDIVFVELPKVGETLAAGARFGTVESVKAVSELYLPVAGTVAEVNTALEEAPERVNTDPYGQGWMLAVVPSDPAQVQGLMEKAAYLAMLKG